MSPRDKFFWLIGGIGAILLFASIVGWVLRRQVRAESGRAVVDNLNQRVRAWWVMVAVFAFAFLAGKVATLVLFALVSFFALREFLTLTPTRFGDHRALSLAFFALIPVQYWLIGVDWYGLFSIFIPVYAFLLLPSLSALAEDTENFLERSAKIQWGVDRTRCCCFISCWWYR
jgi:phosphatidate cytidylyltransferase